MLLLHFVLKIRRVWQIQLVAREDDKGLYNYIIAQSFWRVRTKQVE